MKNILSKIHDLPSLSRRQKVCKIVAVISLFLSVAFDYITKQIVVGNMELYEEIPLWKGVFHWKYIQNRGAAFGMLAERREVFIIISTIAIIVLSLYIIFSRSDSLFWMIGIGILAGGGIGNMIDRIFLGYVIDFMYVALIDFAIFNVADCFICIGVAILMFLCIRDLYRESKEAKNTSKENERHDE